MLSQDCNGPEFSCIRAISVAPMKGKTPRVAFSRLYLPVLWIIQPANIDPSDIATLLGTRCNPEEIAYLELKAQIKK